MFGSAFAFREQCHGAEQPQSLRKPLSTKLNDLLESKGCFANIMSSGRSVSPSSSIETGLSVSGPFSPGRGSVHPDPAADLDLKSSSSHSDQSSETSLPEARKDKYPQEFSLLKLQTKDGQRPEWTFYPRLSSNIHTYHVGKQCFFNGVFLGNRRSLSERTMDKCFGRKKYGNVFLLDLNCAMFRNTPES
ncbi:Spermatogenesis-associated serine-rich protein 1, partial [Eschrichtius robustus]|nr:Spermatogenesis-associated serine-rich protein 1 [Eschrichtius robustus]